MLMLHRTDDDDKNISPIIRSIVHLAIVVVLANVLGKLKVAFSKFEKVRFTRFLLAVMTQPDDEYDEWLEKKSKKKIKGKH